MEPKFLLCMIMQLSTTIVFTIDFQNRSQEVEAAIKNALNGKSFFKVKSNCCSPNTVEFPVVVSTNRILANRTGGLLGTVTYNREYSVEEYSRLIISHRVEELVKEKQLDQEKEQQLIHFFLGEISGEIQAASPMVIVKEDRCCVVQ